MTKFVLVIALFLSCLAGVADAAVVRMFTILGAIDVELDYSAPVTCANFLRYVNEGAYDNSFFHRSMPGFIIQGGGFAVEHVESDSYVRDIPTYDPIINEYSPDRSNLFGTIAMAKTDVGPDTATSQWFFNLNDNSANLDNQNGGFTVFGNVVDGVDVLLALEALIVWDATGGDPNSPFGNLPAIDSFTGET